MPTMTSNHAKRIVSLLRELRLHPEEQAFIRMMIRIELEGMK